MESSKEEIKEINIGAGHTRKRASSVSDGEESKESLIQNLGQLESRADELEKLSEAPIQDYEAPKKLDCLSKAHITEMKSLAKPPVSVFEVAQAVMIILDEDQTWKGFKTCARNPSHFIQRLANYNPSTMNQETYEYLSNFIYAQKIDNIELMKSKSQAAGGFARWVVAIRDQVKAFLDQKEVDKK
mmetsp:Transcript_6963/g.7790  ORF Transcript_6963/g.7790 Transcript_6963/m.7790 type:complete len:186 (+) Transcript_6963:24-581(+)|eukprot:CAMPEP_0205824126 /NCGR_PEP_ID=MMETSP0206-20130828/19553_1 /ASSEMBLY_ACC=CAM_ASM_000279 /TAXON_ID=36767 /ORGANISM="Euplotes focardii, Strain TN1" /LENGTH=185 /DNA_ID=CAMNT_0053121947 /DNA_START=24 /DNA_END=581 /DNA_ORIENTATION=-